ncbi:hypothetical protein M2336_001527 [Sphingobium sp. B1D7B]|uniref:hypothetical protein n=1 Tax=unclassified Sphingobium TaxID=2611147 RepID=UPI002224A8AD|nr:MULTISPECIES: hypothetical protein [unclassified Sphingobium]MCW2393093.1 hypothetical protein [Sphingobium sp. B11D3A]MCW2404898.1 hypothetical protein [Sphingobium sp. B1D7B]
MMRRARHAVLAALALLGAGAQAAPVAQGAFAREHYRTPLAKVCPNPVVVQLDWLPQAEHGGLFQLIGGGGKMSQGRYQGPLGATGIDLLILVGGKGIGLGDAETPFSALYMGNSRAGLRPHLALVDQDNAFIFSRRFPATGVVAMLEKSPMGLFWDRATYPRGFRSVADLRAFAQSGKGKIYLSTTRRTFGRYLINNGLPKDAVQEGYNGDAETFVLNRGRWLNQGSITSEGYQFAHGKRWNKPVDFLLLSDMGYPLYPGMVSVATNRMNELAPCLKGLVPLLQRAQVDYIRAPSEVNDVIYRFNEGGFAAPWWKTSRELLAAASAVSLSRGIVGNGPDKTLGNFDMTRSNVLLSRLKPYLDIRAKPNVKPQDVVTNRFIDPTVGLR